MNTDELKRLAEAATPGPWLFKRHTIGMDDKHTASDDWSIYPASKPAEKFSIAVEGSKPSLSDPEYIAAANPAAILALIAERDALLALLTRCADYMNGPTAWTQEQEDILSNDLHNAIARAAITKAESK